MSGRRNDVDLVCGAVLFVLFFRGALLLADLPGWVARAHPLSTFTWMLTLASLAVTAEAVANRRAWRLRAAVAVAAGFFATALANVAEWAWTGWMDPFLPMVPHIPKAVIFLFIALLMMLTTSPNPAAAPSARTPVRRP